MLVREKPAARLRRWEFTTHHVSIMAVVQQHINRFPGNSYKGFTTFEEAQSFLKVAGHITFHFHDGPADGPKSTSSPNAHYAVIVGQEAHMRRTYR